LSEDKPNVENFKEIKMGDLKLQVQPGMSAEEIDAVLNNNKDE